MGYTAQDVEATTPAFRQQVRQALLAQAQVAAAEDTSTTNHAKRTAFATAVATSMTDAQLTLWSQLAANDGATFGASDATVLARVASLWNLLAGS